MITQIYLLHACFISVFIALVFCCINQIWCNVNCNKYGIYVTLLCYGFGLVLLHGALKFKTIQAHITVAFYLLVLVQVAILFFLMIYKWKIILKNTSPWFLVGIHAFRAAFAVLLFCYYKNAKVPAVLTWLGFNYDILVGLSAVIIAYYLRLGVPLFTKKIFLIVWHFLGLVSILVLLVTIAFYGNNVFTIGLLFLFPACLIPLIVALHVLGIIQSYKQWAYVLPVDYD